MTRSLLIAVTVSVLITIVTVSINHVVQTTAGPAHFWADMFWAAAIASWLIVVMISCTERVVAHLRQVEEVVDEIDKNRVEADAVVLKLFRDKRAR